MIFYKTRDGSVLSDGTLRVLALLTTLYDPDYSILLCLEEPENGVHPARLRNLIELLRNLVSDPGASEVDPEAPLNQLLMNSHSPVVLATLSDATGDERLPSQIFFADIVAVTDPRIGKVRRRTRFRSVRTQAEPPPSEGEGKIWVSTGEVRHYLDTLDHEG